MMQTLHSGNGFLYTTRNRRKDKLSPARTHTLTVAAGALEYLLTHQSHALMLQRFNQKMLSVAALTSYSSSRRLETVLRSFGFLHATTLEHL